MTASRHPETPQEGQLLREQGAPRGNPRLPQVGAEPPSQLLRARAVHKPAGKAAVSLSLPKL